MLVLTECPRLQLTRCLQDLADIALIGSWSATRATCPHADRGGASGGEQTRDFTFIRDVVEANILAAEGGV